MASERLAGMGLWEPWGSANEESEFHAKGCAAPEQPWMGALDSGQEWGRWRWKQREIDSEESGQEAIAGNASSGEYNPLF